MAQLTGIDALYGYLEAKLPEQSDGETSADHYVQAATYAFDDPDLAKTSLLALLELLNPLLFITCPEITAETQVSLATRLYEEERARSVRAKLEEQQ